MEAIESSRLYRKEFRDLANPVAKADICSDASVCAFLKKSNTIVREVVVVDDDEDDVMVDIGVRRDEEECFSLSLRAGMIL